MPLVSSRQDNPVQIDVKPSIGAESWRVNSLLSKSVALDLVERTFLLILFGFFAARMIASLEAAPNVATFMLVVSEVLPIVLIVSRAWSDNISDKPLDWALGFVGASAPLLSVPGIEGTIFPQQLCSLIILAGLSIQISAKVILWRSFGIVAANRGVKVAGPYRIVRHPMYAGYTITHIGFLMAFPSLQNGILYSAALAIQIARLLREERLLNRDPKYRAFSSEVRFRLFPGVF